MFKRHLRGRGGTGRGARTGREALRGCSDEGKRGRRNRERGVRRSRPRWFFQVRLTSSGKGPSSASAGRSRACLGPDRTICYALLLHTLYSVGTAVYVCRYVRSTDVYPYVCVHTLLSACRRTTISKSLVIRPPGSTADLDLRAYRSSVLSTVIAQIDAV